MVKDQTQGRSEIDDPEDGSFGPAMRACSPPQRRFVIAALTFPTGKDWQIAKAAGYSARSHGALRVSAHRLFHDPKVLAALHEEAGKRLRGSAVLGVSILAKIARTDGHKDQLRAAEALLNRVGFHEMTEQVISVTHNDRTGAAMMARIKQLSEVLGVDAAKLLGVNAAPVIEAEVVDGRAPAQE